MEFAVVFTLLLPCTLYQPVSHCKHLSFVISKFIKIDYKLYWYIAGISRCMDGPISGTINVHRIPFHV